MDGVRSGPDIGEGRAVLPTFENYPASFYLKNIDMLRNACRNYAAMFHTHGSFFHADSFNVMTVDKPVPLAAARRSFSLSTLFTGPMMPGDDVSTMSEERPALLKERNAATTEKI